MDFYNPYLVSKKTKLSSSKTYHIQQYHRLIPKCFKTPHVKGNYQVSLQQPPLYFFNGKKCNTNISASNRPLHNTTIDDSLLIFHVYDILESTYTLTRCEDVPFRLQSDIIPSGTVLHLLGKTSLGVDVCVNVFGQKNYFYVLPPPMVDIYFLVQQIFKGNKGHECQYLINQEEKYPLCQFSTSKCLVYKITLSSNIMLFSLCDALQSQGCQLFESNIDTTRRFVIDNGFSTFGWYSCSRASLRQTNKDSNMQLEFDCSVDELTFHMDNATWPPYTIMSFDIECIGEKGFQ